MKINMEQLKHALSAQTFKTDLVANNMANINTSGYKRDIMFMDLLDKFDTNYDNKDVITEFTQGTMKETANPLDVAFSGRGFFVIENNGKEYYTRDGHFTVDNEGNLFITDRKDNPLAWLPFQAMCCYIAYNIERTTHFVILIHIGIYYYTL